jgi:N utilization substance protein B
MSQQQARRRSNRIAALQFLYQWELNPPDNLRFELQQFFDDQEKPRDYYAFAEELVNGAIENREAIDEKIRAQARNWDFRRIAKIDLSILRLAIFELLHRPDIPPVVTINEAIELAKVFSIAESGKFLNGILDRIREGLDRPARTPAI